MSRIALDESSEKMERTRGIVIPFAFLTLGVSSLLPWNALIIALPFFLEKLDGTSLHDTFASWISFLFNGVGLLSIGLATWLGDQFVGPLTCTLSMLTLIIVFGFLTIIPFFDIPVAAFFGTVISASGLLAVAGGLLQTATISLAPVYGPSAITYYMAGSALSAVGVSALQVFTAYTSDSIELPSIDSPSWSATICYATSTVLVVLSLVSFHLLATNSSDLKSVNSKDYRDLPISERTRLLEPTFDSPLPVPQKTDSAQSFNDRRFGRNFAIFYAGIVTLGVFPAITTRIDPYNPQSNPLVFNALHFLVFNVADLIGRAMVSVDFLPSGDTTLVVYSLMRTIFIPAFMVCNVAGHWPTLITSDLTYMLVLFIFGVTCGHLTTLALVSASQGHDPEKGGKETRITQFWMMSGFVAGGIASFGISAAL
ncbi:Equilibrative nucleoside transporter 1 OS=Rattus norvegicus GN=Slc29a1 PE=2 SV=3 [Rhizoctonia solani AG-1 IB]|uniref:Equilibrative nucleoside transporter 1 n=1 Tax=Thanatephorus cucumeris (strain AG1-IB / isolate 7/3/14) TaxID=1108050 RepID=A0A0B7G268_THACB|nr:Equilibrative nucleoside transporter 1 OS=Rattus norvegicus GN=Slc29a1 PE=2 SV=3 [Rhizoctonia solani AG-1 IB]